MWRAASVNRAPATRGAGVAGKVAAAARACAAVLPPRARALARRTRRAATQAVGLEQLRD
jgi:hypothetical protein